jgi:hypothetical protein
MILITLQAFRLVCDFLEKQVAGLIELPINAVF